MLSNPSVPPVGVMPLRHGCVPVAYHADAEGRMAAPTGTVTFLFTGIEGSTRRWDAQPEAMQHALARHAAVALALEEVR